MKSTTSPTRSPMISSSSMSASQPAKSTPLAVLGLQLLGERHELDALELEVLVERRVAW